MSTVILVGVILTCAACWGVLALSFMDTYHDRRREREDS